MWSFILFQAYLFKVLAGLNSNQASSSCPLCVSAAIGNSELDGWNQPNPASQYSGSGQNRFADGHTKAAIRILLELVADLQATSHAFFLPKVALQAYAYQQSLVLERAHVQTQLDQAAGPLHAGRFDGHAIGRGLGLAVQFILIASAHIGADGCAQTLGQAAPQAHAL